MFSLNFANRLFNALIFLSLAFAGIAQADEATKSLAQELAVAKEAVAPELIEKFQKGLSNTKFVGQFTVTGMEDQKPRQEEYTITSVKKLEKGDWWEIKARIKYGDHDLTVPMRMEVKWADKTPVITVDRLFIPGLGTFDARVLLRKDKYAGTWAHDDVGGHLYGRIVKLDESKQAGDLETEAKTDQKD
ncbi:MAG: hypothetical protein AAGA30_20485 [Planctomycetota bacterium]